MPKNTTQCPRPGLEPRPLNPETSTLTMRPPRLPLHFRGATYIQKCCVHTGNQQIQKMAGRCFQDVCHGHQVNNLLKSVQSCVKDFSSTTVTYLTLIWCAYFSNFDNSPVFLQFVNKLVLCSHSLRFFSNTMEKYRNLNWERLVRILTAWPIPLHLVQMASNVGYITIIP